MKRWPCSRTNSSEHSQVLLVFGAGVVGYGFSVTFPPSRPGFEPGGLGHPKGYARLASIYTPLVLASRYEAHRLYTVVKWY